MSGEPIDKQLLRSLIPINGLNAENFNELHEKVSAQTVTAGRYIFKRGDSDKDSIYLLEGEVDLINESGDVLKKIKSGTEAASHPLAPIKPRQLSARATADSKFVRIDSDLLDIMLTWDQTGSYDVVELSDEGGEEEEAGDWMTKLLQTKAFHRIPPANLQTMFMTMEAVSYKAGDTVIKQGDEGDYFYIISHGKCQVVRETPSKPEGVPLATLKEGDSFGEEALISNAKRNATIKMTTEGNLMRLSKSDFETLLKEPLMKVVTLDEAKEKISAGAVLLDVRLPNEFQKWNIKGSINIPLYFLRNKINTLDENKTYIVACDTGRRSSSASYILSERGFDAYLLKDGLQQAMPPDMA
jgi:CRP-like cAMP-binding protein